MERKNRNKRTEMGKNKPMTRSRMREKQKVILNAES